MQITNRQKNSHSNKGGAYMATSSITKNFVVSGQRQVEKCANAIEESYQESLHRAQTPDLRITHLHGAEEVRKFMAKRKKTNA